MVSEDLTTPVTVDQSREISRERLRNCREYCLLLLQ
jgi:hypothetical protein